MGDTVTESQQFAAMSARMCEESRRTASGAYWECGACGYSRFYYAAEFIDGRQGDHTHICADCGWHA